MRSLPLFLSSGFLVLSLLPQAGAPALPGVLTRNFDVLAAAPSLTLEYKLRVVGESPADYKLVFSRPGQFRLTTPTGYVVSDGKMVTTYKNATKTYSQEPFTDGWVNTFAKRPEVQAWGAFLQKDPASSIEAAKAGQSRNIGGNEVTEVAVSFKKLPTVVTLYVDKKIGIARGLAATVEGKDYLVMASSITIGKDPLTADAFAFVAPEGSKKEDAVLPANFASVQALMNDKCMPCHDAVNRKDGVDLSNYTGVLAAVTPGDPANSRLIKSVRATGRDRMPKKADALPEAQIKMLEKWVQDGAKP